MMHRSRYGFSISQYEFYMGDLILGDIPVALVGAKGLINLATLRVCVTVCWCYGRHAASC